MCRCAYIHMLFKCLNILQTNINSICIHWASNCLHVGVRVFLCTCACVCACACVWKYQGIEVEAQHGHSKAQVAQASPIIYVFLIRATVNWCCCICRFCCCCWCALVTTNLRLGVGCVWFGFLTTLVPLLFCITEFKSQCHECVDLRK